MSKAEKLVRILFAVAYSMIAFPTLASAADRFWTNPGGGNWNDGSNWDTGVPGSGDNAFITLAGTYVVTVSVNPSINSLTLGAASGIQTLFVNERTITLNGDLAVGTSGEIHLKRATINLTNVGDQLINAGIVLARGGCAINGSGHIDNQSAGRISISGDDGTFDSALLLVRTGFTNAGVIELTSTTPRNSELEFSASGGVLTNTGTISVSAGAGGNRTLTVELNNQGELNIERDATMNGRSSGAEAHANTGEINLTGGSLTWNLAGDTLANDSDGQITIAAGRTLALSGGTLDYNTNGLQGPGTLSLSGNTTNLHVPFTNSTTTLQMNLSTINGPAMLTNASGLTLVRSTVNAPFANNALLLVRGGCRIGSPVNTFVTNNASTIRISGDDGTSDSASLTVNNGFTNAGAIVLTSTTPRNSELEVQGGLLTNTGTIGVRTDAGGNRTLTVELNNQGDLDIDASTTLTGRSAAADAHVNTGDINVNSNGSLNWNLAGDTLENNTVNGKITIAAGRALTLNGGTFDYNDGTLGGPGTLSLSGNTTNLHVPFTNSTTTLQMNLSTINGPAMLTNASGLTLVRSTVNAPFANNALLLVRGGCRIGSPVNTFVTNNASTIRISGDDGTSDSASLTVNNGFTNAGAIVLTSTTPRNSELEVQGGLLTNTGTIGVRTDAGGNRTLTVELNNQGDLDIDASTTLTGRSAAADAHVNTGDINVNSNGSLNWNLAGDNFTNNGAMTVGAARTLSFSGGTFTRQIGGSTTLNGGTFVAALLDLQGGILGGDGTMSASVNNSGGTIVPGFSPGQLDIIGNYIQSAGGGMSVEIAGLTPGTEYDRMTVSGSATINCGSLEVTIDPGFTPQSGDAFDVLTAALVTGAFSEVVVEGLPSGLSMPISYAPGIVGLDAVAGVPAATITSAVTRKSNPSGPGGICDLPLVPGVRSEPRQGGVTEVRIAFDVPPGGPGNTPVTIQQTTCAAPACAPYAGASTVNASIAGNELVLTFTPGLENARTYRLNLNTSVTSIQGQYVEVRGLVGDATSNGRVDAGDRSAIVGAWTGPGGFSCMTDINNSGQTNAGDRSAVVGAWTSPAGNCAP